MESLGLKSYIPLNEFLLLASSCKSSIRIPLIKHFAETFEIDYKSSYDPKNVKIPFIPLSDTQDLSLPSHCFRDINSNVMGFQVIDQTIKLYSDKLGVLEFPTEDMLVDSLRRNPPQPNNANNVFTFLGTRQSCFSMKVWQNLSQIPFIPLETNNSIKYFKPTEVFLKSNLLPSNYDCFTYVSFNTSADAFLRACGVKDCPSPIELAFKVVESPEYFLQSYETYLDILRLIAANYKIVKVNYKLLSLMKLSKFLMAIDNTGSSQKYSLLKASDIYLVDDMQLYKLFQPMT